MIDYSDRKRKTKCEWFLPVMNAILPSAEWITLICRFTQAKNVIILRWGSGGCCMCISAFGVMKRAQATIARQVNASSCQFLWGASVPDVTARLYLWQWQEENHCSSPCLWRSVTYQTRTGVSYRSEQSSMRQSSTPRAQHALNKLSISFQPAIHTFQWNASFKRIRFQTPLLYLDIRVLSIFKMNKPSSRCCKIRTIFVGNAVKYAINDVYYCSSLQKWRIPSSVYSFFSSS